MTAQGADSKGVALGKISVRNRIVNSSLFALHGSLNSLTAGAMENSTCFVGTVSLADDNGDGVEDLPNPATDIMLGANQPEIRKLTIKGIKGFAGDFFVNSNIAAANMGAVALVRPRYENGVEPFGLAAHFIKKLTVTDDKGKRTTGKNLDTPGDWVLGQQFDFTVHLA